MGKLKDFFTKLLDFIYKKKCYFCGKSHESVKMCSKCYDSLEFASYHAERIILCSDVYVAGIYEKNLQKMIRGLKYHRQKELAYYQAKFMWEYFKHLIEVNNITDDFQVIPVPLYKTRQKDRGYNHMELVAKEFCNLSGYELNTKLIKRVKNTRAQYRLTRIERMTNLKDAFEVSLYDFIPNKSVLLIDDICTTGSTFEEMIISLRSAGIKNITCLATSAP